MVMDWEIMEDWDEYAQRREYQVIGFVNGDYVGIIGNALTYEDAADLGKRFTVLRRATDARNFSGVK